MKINDFSILGIVIAKVLNYLFEIVAPKSQDKIQIVWMIDDN